MPVYFISSRQIDQKKITVDQELAHHLQDVLRLKPGESIYLVDEQQRRYLAKVTESLPGRLILKIEEEEGRPRRPSSSIRLGIGLLKGEKMDWVLQKATELGASSIFPLLTNRVVARPKPDRVAHQRDRWVRIVTEAAQQSGRWEIPDVDFPKELRSFLAEPSDGFKFIFYEGTSPDGPEGAIRPFLEAASSEGTVLVGPEGGWEKEEVAAAIQKGYAPLSLGERTLRSETAALAALAIIRYEIENRRREK